MNFSKWLQTDAGKLQTIMVSRAMHGQLISPSATEGASFIREVIERLYDAYEVYLAYVIEPPKMEPEPVLPERETRG